MTTPLHEIQRAMGRYLRNPRQEPAPKGIEPRRLAVYQELVYNNIEGFISSAFPVLRRLYDDDQWQGLIRAFMLNHRCDTPYFLQISQEFLRFLMECYELREGDYPFLQELAHYEWLELYLDTLDQDLPSVPSTVCVLTDQLSVSPLVVAATYQYPVHEIGPGHVPLAPSIQPNYLVVYRKRNDEVCFMKVSQATVRLLNFIRENASQTGMQVLEIMAKELGMDAEASLAFGQDLLNRLVGQDIVLASNKP